MSNKFLPDSGGLSMGEYTSKLTDNKISDEDAKKSIFFKTQLSLFQSPYAQVTTSPSVIPDYNSNPPYLEPHIKIVTYGTGTGKTYGALKQYLLFASMDYPDKNPSDIYPRSLSESDFTNGIFATPNKNQIHFDSELVELMLKIGITPLSVLALSDARDSDNKLWNDGLVTTEQRLKDYAATLSLIIDTHVKNPKSNLKGWQKSHVSLLFKQVKALRYAVADLKDFYLNPPLDASEYKARDQVLTLAHDKAVQVLVLTALNNIFHHHATKDIRTFALSDDPDAIENTFTDNEEDQQLFLARTLKSPSKPPMYPIAPTAVYSTIFFPAKTKPHYDCLLTSEVAGHAATLTADDTFDCMLATFKKDLLRVYAPMNYATHMPSFICMTTSKLRVHPNLYRCTNSFDTFEWVFNRTDYSDFAELIGNKQKFQAALPAIPNTIPDAKEQQIAMLKATIMNTRQDLREVSKDTKIKGAGFDNRSPYVKNNIDFYIVIDESNELFIQSFLGDKVTSGVVKPVFNNCSVTDLFSTVSRKYREVYYHPADSIDCLEQNKYFFECMFFYLENFCEIDPYKVFAKPAKQGESKRKKNGRKKKPKSYLLNFDFPPNILYIDNKEANSIISIIKNAFSVTAKRFIDKEKLESIYVCRKGQQLYLSADRKKKSDLTLYELYQIIISILFAAMRFEGNSDTPSKFNPSQRKAFYLDLDTNAGEKSERGMRQNAPLAELIAFCKRHASKYQEWLLSNHMRSEDDATIDDWFSYIQTKLLFTLTRNKVFDASPDLGHQSKTFLDIKMHLITHHPELDVLKMVAGTHNHLHLMSATSGKTEAYSGQFNINFMRNWGKHLGVHVNLPEYDHAQGVDYRETFTKFRDLRTKMRDIKVTAYDSSRELTGYIEQPTPAAPTLSINPPKANSISPSSLRSYFDALSKSVRGYDLWFTPKSFNNQVFNDAITCLYIALQRQDTSLIITYRADLNKSLLASMNHELETGGPNDRAIKNAIHNNKTSVVLQHRFFGEFQLPLLNDYLKQNYKAVNKASLTHHLKEQFAYLVDFYDLSTICNSPANKVSRVALYDNKIDRMRPDYRNYFCVEEVEHKGQIKQLYTTIVSYNKAAGLGLNNVIDNKILGLTEDVNRLMLPSLPFWTDITSSDDSSRDDNGFDGRHKIHNSLIYMRYLAHHSDTQPVSIKHFDSNLASKQANDLLTVEHNLQLSNAFKQALGRPERKDSQANFQSEIILPSKDLKEQTKINYIAYGLNKSLESHRDNTDYAFLSMNNYQVLKHGMNILSATTTTSEKRLMLEQDTRTADKRITSFTNGFDGFMGKVLQAARGGDESDEARKIADAAIDFDLTYRLPCILLDPHQWLTELKESELLTNSNMVRKLGWRDVDKYLDSMYVDLSKYANNNKLEVYPNIASHRQEGLTDFFGKHSDATLPYNPSSFVVSNINPAHIHPDDANLARLVEKSNKLTDSSSDLYNQDTPADLILHPAMMHMALGNLGERVFDYFLDVYSGSFDSFSQKDVVHKFGYRFYELFDFWLYNHQKKRWVCVDIKNYSHKENYYQTEKLLASSDRKTAKISNAALFGGSDDDALTEHLKGMSGLFEHADEMDMVFINVRNGDYANSRRNRRKISIDGRDLVINIHHINLYKPVHYIKPTDRKLVVHGKYADKTPIKPKPRKEFLAINPTLLELLSIDPSVGINDAFFDRRPEQDVDYEIGESSKLIAQEQFIKQFTGGSSNADHEQTKG